MSLGPTPFPTAQELADEVNARVPGALLDLKADQRVQR
jgi:hypothetical protein